MRMLQISQESDGQSIALNVGETLEIHLIERRMTGRRWRLASSGEPVCKLVEDTVEAAAAPLGRPGTRRWRFQAVAAGTAVIHLDYQRLGRDEQLVERTFTIVVNVS
jgi:predicted secreted protein